MNIVDARVIVCSPGRNFVTLKVTTEDGIYGLGDATLNGRELAVAAYLSEHVVPLLIGRDARRIEDTWHYLYKGAYWRRGPVTMAAIAAVDTALWDIKGKALGVPVYQLLGGRSRDAVMVYGHANGADVEARVQAVARHIEEGYVAVRAQSGVPGLVEHVRRAQRRAAVRTRRTWAAVGARVEQRTVSRVRAVALRTPAAGVWPRRPSAARRASPADADRGRASRQEPRAAPSLLARGSGPGRNTGVVPSHTAAHHDTAGRRRGVQHDLRLSPVDPGAVDRLHPHVGRPRGWPLAPREDRRTWPNSTRCAPGAMAPRTSAPSAWPRRCTSG